MFCDSSVTSLDLPSFITVICRNMFRGAADLQTLTIPKSVIKIEPYAFKDCDSLCSYDPGSDIFDSNITFEDTNSTWLCIGQGITDKFDNQADISYYLWYTYFDRIWTKQ